jgi:hypothetical protein
MILSYLRSFILRFVKEVYVTVIYMFTILLQDHRTILTTFLVI